MLSRKTVKSDNRTLRPDSKGRVTLGALAQGVSSFHVTKDKNNRIILEPYAEIPAREKWLFDNSEALAKVKKGIEDSAAGRVTYLGDFTKYIDEE